MSIAFTDNDVLGKFTGEQTLERFAQSIPQRYALAKLIGYCEGLCSKDLLGEQIETELRKRVAETLSAFNMEPHQS